MSTNARTGLTKQEAERRLELFGENALPEKEDSLLYKFLVEFVQPMPLVIWVAVAIEITNVSIEWPSPTAATGIADIVCLIVLQFRGGEKLAGVTPSLVETR